MMIYGYDKIYLEQARVSLGNMLHYAVYGLNCSLPEFWKRFCESYTAKQFEHGSPTVFGRSGTELALIVLGIDKNYPEPVFSSEKSEEYWAGWALAYYQWETGLSFSQITKEISIEEIRSMYPKYHEMDIRQFCDKMDELYTDRKTETNLKMRRLLFGLSQSELANISGVPVRTLQQYEQGQKNINKARADYVCALSRALRCDPASLLEKNERNGFAKKVV